MVGHGRVHFPSGVLSKYYIPMFEKLKEDGFVPDDLAAALSTFPEKLPTGSGRCCGGQNLYKLNDTFILDFSAREQYFTVITENGIESLKFALFLDSLAKITLPYTGAYTNHHISMPLD